MTTTPNRRPLVEHRQGRAYLAGTCHLVSSIRTYLDNRYSMATIRRGYAGLADWTNAELAEVATYPRVEHPAWPPTADLPAIWIDGDGDINVDGYVTTANLPALIALLQEAAAKVEAWRAECAAWMEEHNQ